MVKAWPFTALDSVVCLGAHPDDIEIGVAGTLLRLIESNPSVEVEFVIATGSDERQREAHESADHLMGGRAKVTIGSFRDGFLPYADPAGLKDWLRGSTSNSPDLVLTPSLDDRHQDHRVLGEMAWQLFRGSTILEYEIPKWEGDHLDANLFVVLDETTAREKVDHLMSHFPSQHHRTWYRAELFEGLARLRGMEAGATHAEGLRARKLSWRATETESSESL